MNRASEKVTEEEELDDDYEELVNPAYDVPRRLLPPREAYYDNAGYSVANYFDRPDLNADIVEGRDM